ncbi:MAG: tetratricopeptide repeat protein [Candidatus Eremiobacteraeota bacterium]|nr:tetratricopeptide repeat protein [Candidatus Eremiobacteraeota bacterium]
MIVKDEERFLEQCLTSVAGCVDEICIVDTGSTDATIEIAKRFGARIERRAWRDDFAWARNEAISMATKRWIFMLDADEELAPESRGSLKTIGMLPAGITALYVACDNLSDDYKGTGSISHLIARIFPNHPKIRFISPVHEYVSFDGDEMGTDSRLSDVRIIHHGYLKEIVAGRNKAERNFALIRRATELHPEDAFHWYNLGMTAHVVKDYEQAIEALEKMRLLIGDGKRAFLPQALVTLAECYSDQRNDEERAMHLVKESLSKSPHLTNAHFGLGRILSKLGRFEEARVAFLHAIEAEKYRSVQFIVDDQIYLWKAQLSLGVTYAEEKRWEEALEWYDRGLANQPHVQPLLINRAHALERLERYDEAEQAFRSLLERFADETGIVQYINFLLRRRHYDQAAEMMEARIHDVSPRIGATFMVAAAQMAHRAGDKNSELRYLLRANELDPAAGPVLDALEAFYQSNGDTEKVNALYEDELRFEPVEPPDFVRRSFRFLARGRFQEAHDAAQAGLKHAPIDPELRYNSAVAKVQLGDGDGAVADLAVVPFSSPAVGQKAALLRARLLGEGGKWQEALHVLDASFDDLMVAEAALLRAKNFEHLGQVDEAAGALESIFGAERQRVGMELASLYMRHGRFAEAQTAAERALAKT